MNLSKLPIVSYFRRYWWILVLTYLAYLFARAESVWNVVDVFAYMPLALLAIASVGLFFRNVFHKKTTDEFVDSGDYAREFKVLSPKDKVWITSVQWIGYMIAGGLVALGLLIVLAGLPALAPS